MTWINTLLLLAGLLVFLSVLASTISARMGVPLLLIFLGLGMLAGEDGPGGIIFDDFNTAFLISNLALAVILLDGGLRTKSSTFRAALVPAGVLATIGVALTAGLLGVFATWILEVDWRYGLLLSAIVSSTDAAAVFNVLRHGGVTLNQRVGATLEIESGTNDPMAIFLVTLLIELLSTDAALGPVDMALRLVLQFGLGALIGVGAGYLLVRLMNRLRLAEGLYALLIVSGGLVTFGFANQIGGSGFLAIYLVGLWVGNSPTRSDESVKQVMDGLAWLSQAGMFLVLGLLVTPSLLLEHMQDALIIAGFLILIARPVAVYLSLIPFRFPWREQTFIAWVGLRGAVPVVLAVFPVMAGLPNSMLLFDITFVVVCASLLIQGASVRFLANWFGVSIPGAAAPIESHRLWAGQEGTLEISAFKVEPDSSAEERTLGSLGVIGGNQQCVLLIRNGQRIPSEPDTTLKTNDEVWLMLQEDEIDNVAAFFSHAERRGALASHNFFGEFVIDGESSADDIASLYGISISDEESSGTVAQLLVNRLGKKLVVGDRLTLGYVRLTVRAMKGTEVKSVGLKILSTSV